MSSNLPTKGKGLESAERVYGEVSSREDLPTEEVPSAGRSVQSSSQDRKLQAISDAQQGLSSLLKHHTGDTQPHVIISPSGVTRNQTRGRIAGPTADPTPGPVRPSRDRHLLNGQSSNGSANGKSALSIVPGQFSEYAPKEDTKKTGGHLAQHLQTVRDQASLLISPTDGANPLGLGSVTQADQVSRRAASQWVTRYATHVIIFLVVGMLVAVGGFKSLTAELAYPGGLHALDAYTGTDHFEDEHEHSADGKLDIDSPDFEITLPRTELAGLGFLPQTQATEGQDAPVAQADGPDPVARYTVAAGDTIESIAAKFKLMPETVMGSNGIYDLEESLEPGEVLNIPPIDGMYYVAAQGDSVEGIASRFQVDPAVILHYQANNLGDGVVKEGQQIIVPGGMMPPRDVTITYTVRRGDTLKGIAARFGIDVPTMIYSNDIPDPDALEIGAELRVLPVQGVEYKIKKGDTILALAERYRVPAQTILDYEPNQVSLDTPLQVDQVIMIPGGRPPRPAAAERVEPSSRGSSSSERQQASPAKNKSNNTSKSGGGQAAQTEARPAPTPVPPKPQARPQPKPQQPAAKSDDGYKGGSGRLSWPVRGRITQYFSKRHNGLDIAAPAGTPLHAADSGRVIWAGWRNDGLGYAVIIDHLNGMMTIYGHMLRQPYVYVGQSVKRNQVIGPLGSTGRSTGPHVHFMVKVGGGYRNPLAYLGK